jgi:asparagine synthase (glutamine-hydrolysing)
VCGITGFLTSVSENSCELEAIVGGMTDQLAHRGPDDCGIWVDQSAGVAFGHRRLSIVDLSSDGHQPMYSETGRYVIVFNGEVYNFKELRRDLARRSHRFRGHSDTEVILAAVEEWGVEKALSRLNGMFAFAIWDVQEGRLHLVRDRLGEKPLYYGWMGKSFLFGSELKALAAYPDFEREVDLQSLAMYLKYNYIPTPYSIYRGIRKLPSGTRIEVTSGSRKLLGPILYWSAIEGEREIKNGWTANSEEQAVLHLDELLRDAVQMRMVADVPLGAFLSGGIDSSLIVALMQRQSTTPVRTFTVGFSEDHYDEAKNAAAVARHLGTNHTEMYVSADETAEIIPLLPSVYDEPFADSSQIPTLVVSRLARQHVTVSLSGDGGDELFGGYRRYFLWGNLWERLKSLPRRCRRFAIQALRSLDATKWNAFVRGFDAGVSFPGDKMHRLARLLAAESAVSRCDVIVSGDEGSQAILRTAQSPETVLRGDDPWPERSDFREFMMLFDTVTYLPDDILVKVDRASMAVALETRLPYLDHRVAELALQMPLPLKIRRGVGKWILRQVLYQYVPKHLVDRPKKGFSVPIGEWLRGRLRDWVEELLGAERLRRGGFFDPGAVRNLWNDHLSARRDAEHQVWAVLMFQAWLDEWGKQIRPVRRKLQVAEAHPLAVRA